MSRHQNRLAVVTGGANGIGQAIALRLAEEGARVAVLDITDAAETIEHGGPSVQGFQADLADATSTANALGAIRDALGDPQILIHAAAFQQVRAFDELSDDDWSRTMSVNVDGAFRVIKGTLPAMRAAGWGRIVVVTSSSFFAPPPGMSHYIASKGALLGLVRGLAAEVGVDGVTVNALAPGLTRTENAIAHVPASHFADVVARQAIKRSGEPHDQASAASFLVSDESGFMTGQTLLVDGGEGHV